MPTVRIPLAGVPNQRNVNAGAAITAGKDQRFIAAMFSRIPNPNGQVTTYVEKRSGMGTRTTVQSGVPGIAVKTVGDGGTRAYVFYDLSGTTKSTVYLGTTSAGTTDASTALTHVTECVRSGTRYLMFSSNSSGACYYLSLDSNVTSAINRLFNGDTTNGNADLTNVNNTSGMLVGQLVTGSGIPSNTRITAINGTTVTMSANATATASNVSISRDALAKIMDSDFPSGACGPFVDLDGYLFIADGTNRRIYQSDLNSVTSWAANNYITTDTAGGALLAVEKLKDSVMAIMAAGTEVYQNNGNPTGSVLTRIKNSFSSVGVVTSLAFCTIEDRLYSIDRHGGVYVKVGAESKKISNPSVERVIQSNSAPSICAAYFAGKPFLVVSNDFLQSPVAAPDYSYFYDIETGYWSETGLGVAVRLDSQYVSNITWGVGYDTTGKDLHFNFISPVYADDSSTAYVFTVQTSRVDHGTDKRKSVRAIRLIADKQASGTATLEYSDDDYATWTTAGTFDMTSQDKRIVRLGSYKGGRAYRLTHSAATAFRAEALEIEYEVAA